MGVIGQDIITSALENLSQNAGVPLDQCKLFFCFLVAYPLAAAFNFMPNNAALKHSYGLVGGLWFAYFCLGNDMLVSLVSSTIVYGILNTMDIKKGIAHKVIFFFTMAVVSMCHIRRMRTDYLGWAMDFTGPQMLLTLRLTTLAFDLYDGTRKQEELSEFQKTMYVTKIPNPLEYYAYLYFFPGFLAGPCFNFKEYISFIDGSLFNDTPNKRAPSPWLPALRKFLESLVLAGMIFAGKNFPILYETTPQFFASSFLEKCVFIWFAAFFSRFPYYFAWVIAEGACNLSGIGFAGYDKNKEALWTRATNVRVLPFELAQNFRSVTDNWNICTDKWLKHYIYERVPFYPVQMTLLCSSVWHGFYAGYYLSFMSAAFMIHTARLLRRNVRSRFMEEDGETPKPAKMLYDVVCLFGTSFVLNYLMTPFKLLSFWESLNVWVSVYFIGHVLTALAFVLSVVLGAPRRPKTTVGGDKDKMKAH